MIEIQIIQEQNKKLNARNLTPNGTYLPLKAFTIPIPAFVGKAKRAKRNLKPGGMKKPEPMAMQKSQVLSYKSGPGFLINSRSFSIDIRRSLEFFKSMSWSSVCGSFDLSERYHVMIDARIPLKQKVWLRIWWLYILWLLIDTSTINSPPPTAPSSKLAGQKSLKVEASASGGLPVEIRQIPIDLQQNLQFYLKNIFHSLYCHAK